MSTERRADRLVGEILDVALRAHKSYGATEDDVLDAFTHALAIACEAARVEEQSALDNVRRAIAREQARRIREKARPQ